MKCLSSVACGAFVTLSALCPLSTLAMPPYQEYSEQHSGRTTNCAMCHMNPTGPTGDGPGQLGSLTPEELAQVHKAESALQPGSEVDNPVLNKFGNAIIHKIGMAKFLELTADPGKLPEAYGFESDLDGDGIPDAQEYLDGTNPLDKYDGDPAKLFFINLNRFKFDILLATVAVFLLEFGLRHLLRGTTMAARVSGKDSNPPSE